MNNSRIEITLTMLYHCGITIDNSLYAFLLVVEWTCIQKCCRFQRAYKEGHHRHSPITIVEVLTLSSTGAHDWGTRKIFTRPCTTSLLALCRQREFTIQQGDSIVHESSSFHHLLLKMKKR